MILNFRSFEELRHRGLVSGIVAGLGVSNMAPVIEFFEALTRMVESPIDNSPWRALTALIPMKSGYSASG